MFLEFQKQNHLGELYIGNGSLMIFKNSKFFFIWSSLHHVLCKSTQYFLLNCGEQTIQPTNHHMKTGENIFPRQNLKHI